MAGKDYNSEKVVITIQVRGQNWTFEFEIMKTKIVYRLQWSDMQA